MKSKFYITTPIYYVNASPHIGHSYTTIAADTLIRYARKAKGKENAWFLTGTDEHGQKIQKAADEAHLTCKEYVDQVVVQFQGLWEKLHLSYDDFIRTTQERHTAFVSQALQLLFLKGDIYLDTYEGWYCIPCETFWPKTQVSEQLCPDCKRPIENISEKNYFFKLSAYQQWLIDYIKAHPGFIRPQTREAEVLSFLTLNPLADLCISRPKERLSWGIPLPFSPQHVAYVWFDALLNYVSAVGTLDSDGNYHSQWWGEDVEVVHLIGKDILRQHAVYWPIMLQALGMRLPDTIFAHGWWMLADAKMSKSRGNVVSPLAMVDKFGIDTYRYFLLRDVPFGLDGNFSEDAIIKRYNGDLANDLGNLVYRTLTMIEKYYSGEIPRVDASKETFDVSGEAIKARLAVAEQSLGGVLSAGEDFNFSKALDDIWVLINMANKYIEQTKPWNLVKENKPEELKKFIRLLVDAIRVIAQLITPFMPQTGQSIAEQFGEGAIKKGAPLFPRIDTAKPKP